MPPETRKASTGIDSVRVIIDALCFWRQAIKTR